MALLLLASTGAVFAQSADQRSRDEESRDEESRDNDRLVIARGLSEYPVTVGDQYRVYFQRAGGTSQIEFSVPGSYQVNLGPVGSFSVEGMVQEDLRERIENAVSDAYPGSFPRLELVSVGLFRVRLTGAIPDARTEQAWGLTQLSEIVRGADTSEASLRRVTILSDDGDSNIYDLFRARRGESEEDPLVRPGDRIEFRPRFREVTVRGEVRFPGTYELLESDTLEDTISRYAGGMTDLAVRDRVEIQRVANDGEAERIDFTDQMLRNTALADGDTIIVRSHVDTFPTVVFEGAIRGQVSSDEEVAGTTSQSDLYRYTFRPGETAAEAVRAVRSRFLTTADFDRAFLERDGERINLDVESMLYAERIPESIELRRNDRIVVPFRQYFVSVSGAVSNPGQYPYIPNRGYQYYLGLAGGTDPQRHIGENPRIRDVRGERKRDNAVIEPEDDIFFASTNPIYHLSPILGVASTVLSTIAIFLSIAN